MHSQTHLFRNSLKCTCLFELFSKENETLKLFSKPMRIKDCLDETGKEKKNV